MFKKFVLLVVVGYITAKSIDIACVQDSCGAGFACIGGKCVNSTGMYCPADETIGVCVDGYCAFNDECVNGACCEPGKAGVCNKDSSKGACVFDQCPDLMTCVNGFCC